MDVIVALVGTATSFVGLMLMHAAVVALGKNTRRDE